MSEWSTSRTIVALVLFVGSIYLLRRFLIGVRDYLSPAPSDWTGVSHFLLFCGVFIGILFAIGYYVDKKNGLR